MIFVELESDPFVNIAASEKTKAAGASFPIRRPLLGIDIKPDSYAYFKVVNRYGRTIPVLDAGGPEDDPDHPGIGITPQYTNFLVQSVSQASAEKQQIIPTFGDDYVFFYGTQPKIYQISGVLMNSKDFKWASEFWYNYETYLRGTKLVEMRARIYFYCDGIIWEGYLMQAQARKNVATPNLVTLELAMLVIKEHVVEDLANSDLPYNQGDPAGTKSMWGSISNALVDTQQWISEDPSSQTPGIIATKAIAAGMKIAQSAKGGTGIPTGNVMTVRKIRDNKGEYVSGNSTEIMSAPDEYMQAMDESSQIYSDIGDYLSLINRNGWGPLVGLSTDFGIVVGS